MAIVKARGAIRVGRRSESTRLLIKPAKSRKGLLLGSSFAGGALMVIGATMMMPNAAQAACTAATGGATDTITCLSDNNTAIGGTTLTTTPANDPATVNLGYNVSGVELNINSTIAVTSSGTGTIDAHINSDATHKVTITVGTNNSTIDALTITASGVRTNPITVVTGANSVLTNTGTVTTPNSQHADGIRVVSSGASSTAPITVTSASTISVTNDGIHIDEKGTTASGAIKVTSTGAITAGKQTGGTGFVDWNGISVEATRANVEVDTSGAGTVEMQNGNQAAIWTKTFSGTTTINVGAAITGTAQTAASGYGAGVMVVSGGSTARLGGGDIVINSTAAINTAGNGIIVGQFSDTNDTTGSVREHDITITSSGKITSVSGNGIQIAGFTSTGGIYHDSEFKSAGNYIAAADSDITITTKSGGEIQATGTGGKGIAYADRGGSTGDRAENVIQLGDALTSYSTGIDLTSTNGNVTITTLAGDDVTTGESGEDASTNGGSIVSSNGSGIAVHAGGAFTLTNDNHIEGAGGDGVFATGGTFANITNNSLNSIISGGVGDSGIDVSAYEQVYFDNRGALTAGVGSNAAGAYIHGISGDNVTEGDTVFVDNTYSWQSHQGGIIVGTEDGLIIQGIDSPSEGEGIAVYVDNSGGWHHHHRREGGFIAGLGGDNDYGVGVGVYNTEGDVTIDNSKTRNWRSNSLSESDIDPQVGLGDEGEGGILAHYPVIGPFEGMPEFTTYLGLSDEFENGTGIWGWSYGVQESNIEGHAYINNERGLIVGLDDGSTGVALSNVGGGVEIDNSSPWARAGHTDDYSLILGSGQGIDLTDIWGGIDVNNAKGIVYAHGGNAITITGSSEGDNTIENAAGAIVSYYGNAVQVSEADGNVLIRNSDDGAEYGGAIVGGTSAIVVGSEGDVGAHKVTIYNGESWWDHHTHSLQGGLIAGGNESGVDAPVIFLHTEADSETGGAYIGNEGIIANLGPNPYNTFTGDNADNVFASYLSGVGIPGSLSDGVGNLKPIYRDAAKISVFVKNDGDTSWGSLSPLAGFAGAAGSAVVVASGGATEIENEDGALLFGTVDLSGRSAYNYETDGGNDYYSSSIWNRGKWFTLGDNTVADATGESDEGFIQNDGFIQTAFGTEGGDFTTFNVSNFSNDGEDATGYVSMVDGDALDRTTFNGDFYGSGSEGELSFLAVDTYLDSSESGLAESDVYTITGKTYGTTGIIVHNINPGASADSNTDGILVVEAEGGVFSDNGYGGQCTANADGYCVTGDAFFISSATQGYEDVQGYGTIRDGLFSWFLQDRPTGEGDNFYLTSHLSSDGAAQASTTSIVQALALEGLDAPEENDAGNTYPLGTSGGADPASGTVQKGGLWGRINGTWAKRTTTVEDVVPYDTSSNQNIYSITAGLEARPNGGDDGLRLGVYGGYVATTATLDGIDATTTAKGGSVGGYAVFNNGGWYVDGEVKADFVGITYASTTTTLETHGTNIAGQVNTGYRMENGGAFFEPIASFSYATTSIADATDGVSTVTYNAGNSIRAGLGARTGVTVGKPGGAQATFDITGKVWDEFGGPNTVSINDGATTLTAVDNIAGISGEVIGRATIFDATRTSSGFVQVGGKFGANSTSITAKAGLRKNF